MNILKPTILSGTVLITLSACSYNGPVAIITDEGRILKGTFTASMNGSHFNVSDGNLTCAGSYVGTDFSTTISMPVTCNDGRKGMAVSTRDSSGTSGTGHFKLNDGSGGDFVFGKPAEALQHMEPYKKGEER